MSQREFGFLKQRLVHSVTDAVRGVRERVESAYRDVWIRGEIVDLRRPRSGHVYFALKDDSARLRAVCFRLQARYLKIRPADGLEVLARGSMTVYAPQGDVQFVVQHMEPLGHGAQQLAFEELKNRLAKEGLFDPAAKQPLPMLPRRIGVITSPTGAAVRDILNVLERRNDLVSILIYPAKVQGTGAAETLIRGIRVFGRRGDVDVIVISRGGGSSEDLSAFNDERLARAIFASRIPVISAVGHETDFTICDFVSDFRAPTPSAAAETVAAARAELHQRVDQLTRRAVQACHLVLHRKRSRLARLAASRSFIDAETRLRYFLQRLDELQGRLAKCPEAFGRPRREKIADLTRRLREAPKRHLADLRLTVAGRSRELQAFSPLAVLERGYSIVSTGDGTIVRSAQQVAPGGRFHVRVRRGDFEGERLRNEGQQTTRSKRRSGKQEP